MHSYYFCLNFLEVTFTSKFTSLSFRYLSQTLLQAMNFSVRSLQNASVWARDVFGNAGSTGINLLCELSPSRKEKLRLHKLTVQYMISQNTKICWRWKSRKAPSPLPPGHVNSKWPSSFIQYLCADPPPYVTLHRLLHA